MLNFYTLDGDLHFCGLNPFQPEIGMADEFGRSNLKNERVKPVGLLYSLSWFHNDSFQRNELIDIIWSR